MEQDEEQIEDNLTAWRTCDVSRWSKWYISPTGSRSPAQSVEHKRVNNKLAQTGSAAFYTIRQTKTASTTSTHQAGKRVTVTSWSCEGKQDFLTQFEGHTNNSWKETDSGFKAAFRVWKKIEQYKKD